MPHKPEWTKQMLHRALQRASDVFGEREGLSYRGPADFVLQHGRWYSAKLNELPTGHPSTCYGNAIIVAVVHGLPYVEGYALSPIGRIFPHAWNAQDVYAIDTTWRTPGLAYVGVEFSVERADDCTWNGDATVLNDYKRGWPLLRQPWHGEDASIEWPPSERLEILRSGDRSRFKRLLEQEKGEE